MSGVLVCLIEKPLHFAQLSQLGQDTWLILPAVICSDKRLSHACLRICVQLNLRTAHYNSYNLFELCILNGYLR